MYNVTNNLSLQLNQNMKEAMENLKYGFPSSDNVLKQRANLFYSKTLLLMSSRIPPNTASMK